MLTPKRPKLEGLLGLGMAIVAEGGVLAIGIPVWAEYCGLGRRVRYRIFR